MTEQTEQQELKKGCFLHRERAVEIVDEFLEHNLVDFDDYDPKDEDEAETLSGLKSAKRVLVKAVERGLLEFKLETDKKGVDRMQSIQNRMIPDQPPIIYGEVGGIAMSQMKHVGEKNHVGKMHAVMASISGTNRAFMQGLQGFEHKIMMNLATIFLAQ